MPSESSIDCVEDSGETAYQPIGVQNPLLQVIHAICGHIPWVQRDRFDGRVPPSHFPCVQNIRQFALGVPLLVTEICLSGSQFCQADTSRRRPLMRCAGDNDDSDITWRHSGCPKERREEKLDQEGVAEVVDADMPLEAVLRQRGRCHEDTSVADEDIETGRE